MSFKANLPSDADLATMFGTVDTFAKFKVGDKVVIAGSEPILKRAKEIAPRDRSKHGEKRSKKQRSTANWNLELWRTIKRKVVKLAAGAMAVVGPKWPEGNKAYFDTSPNGRRIVLWGKLTGRVKVQIRNWIVQAADETRPEQLNQMRTQLSKSIDEVMRG